RGCSATCPVCWAGGPAGATPGWPPCVASARDFAAVAGMGMARGASTCCDVSLGPDGRGCAPGLACATGALAEAGRALARCGPGACPAACADACPWPGDADGVAGWRPLSTNPATPWPPSGAG